MMPLDRKICYRALCARDPRFDGKFFTAVLTTGIYCRPVCPARTPKMENVRFFSCAAAAEEAGFRPCRRCRPETAPGTPAWNGTATSVARAVRLIEGGFLNEHSIEELAALLGMGSRHLRRLFLKHLGASPKAVDTTRKTHLAARLLAESTLPISAVALDAGFASLRRFNEAFLKSFALSPTAVRERRAGGRGATAGSITLRLSYRPPYDWPGIIEFLAKRVIPGVEEVVDGTYRRGVRAGEWRGSIAVTNDAGSSSLLVTIDSSVGAHLAEIVERVRHVFDLRSDPAAVSGAIGQDPLLGRLAAGAQGVRIPGIWDTFEALARAIIGQQISVSAACTVLGRLSALFGEELPAADGRGVRLFFPTPERISGADLRSVGMPEARGASLRAAAKAVADGSLDFRRTASAEEALAQLRALPGIGPWSAEYVLLRGLSEPDAFPASHLGIRKAMMALVAANTEGTRAFDGTGGRQGSDGSAAFSPRLLETSIRQTIEATMDARQVSELAERWRPWRGYVAILLWRSLATANANGPLSRRARAYTKRRIEEVAQ